MSLTTLQGQSGRRTTPAGEIDQALVDLQAAKEAVWRATPRERLELVRECIEGAARLAPEWVEESCRAKGLDPRGPAASEEIASGPMAVVRYLQLLKSTLRNLHDGGVPRLPAMPRPGPDGRLLVPVFPARGLFDRLLFAGFKAHAWMRPGLAAEHLFGHLSRNGRGPGTPGVCLVLGAGNVAAIPATDALERLFVTGKAVLLKMNPVNDYLGEIFAEAFAPLVRRNYLRIVYGGPEAGAYAVAHELVDEVHITGSAQTHEAIVWGPAGPEHDRRLAENSPLLKKPITSELGNVTPWIVVPGPYTERELDFQAENVAAMIVNNASFNCIAARMIVTWRGWPDRQRFLDKVQAVLARVPPRRAWYPGAADRFRRFTGSAGVDRESETLPWTLVRDVRPDDQPHWFREESFVCACAETALEAASAEEFLDQVADFCNDRLWGTLGAGLMVHRKFRAIGGNEARLRRAVSRLRYGTVAINHWPALAYAMMSVPWGGHAGGTLADPQSGIGWVHNTWLLDGVEKSVLEGPLVVRPKPFWFPTHRRAHRLAWRVFELYQRPRWNRLLKVLAEAV